MLFSTGLRATGCALALLLSVQSGIGRGEEGGRCLLAISLSRDGLNFDRMAVIRFVAPERRYEGRSKSIGYAYPHSAVVGEDLWVIYSVNKEDIEIAHIPLSELKNLK